MGTYKNKVAVEPVELGRVIAELRSVREAWRLKHGRVGDPGGREFPSREALREIVAALSACLFPMRLGPTDLRQDSEDYFIERTLESALTALLDQVKLELRYAARLESLLPTEDFEPRATEIVNTLAGDLPRLRALLDTDIDAAFRGDPAARSVDEVLLCYPGILAIIYHRLAHALYRQGVPLVARMIAELAHSETGIDIHPGARIGSGFFIDHGTGVVIGETAIIGNDVRLYQAVTLGAKSFPTDQGGAVKKGLPRHPILEDEVVVYAGATILGRITIGRGSRIGGNVWLTHSVPPGSHITQASARNDLLADGAGI